MTKLAPDEIPQAPLDADSDSSILDAAHTVFLRRGTAGARMTQIARAAGLSHAPLHDCFRSKPPPAAPPVAARMTGTARDAGVNHALLHYYFRSKQRLAEAVFRRAIGQFFPVMMGILASDAQIEEKVRRVAAAQIDMLLENRFLPGYLLAELNHYPERASQLLSTMAGTSPSNVRV